MNINDLIIKWLYLESFLFEHDLISFKNRNKQPVLENKCKVETFFHKPVIFEEE